MVAQVSKTDDAREVDQSRCVAEGQRLGLYDAIEDAGPVTAFGLASRAMIPVSLALRWLASQTDDGYVVRDVATGRYRTWCVLPEEVGS